MVYGLIVDGHNVWGILKISINIDSEFDRRDFHKIEHNLVLDHKQTTNTHILSLLTMCAKLYGRNSYSQAYTLFE